MRIFRPLLLMHICSWIFAATVSGQVLSPDEQQRRNEQQQREAIERRDKIFKDLDIKASAPGFRRKLTPEQKALRRDSKKYAKKLEELQAAPASYHEKFAALLAADKKMNLVRLFPDKGCDIMKKKVVSVENSERCAEVIPVAGGGAYYSFKEKSNYFFYAYGADLYFTEDKFYGGSAFPMGNSFNEGIISEIGDVALETLDLESEPFKFLVENDPKPNLIEMKKFGLKLQMGITSGEFLYSTAAPLKLNSVYVLRSVAYKPFLAVTRQRRAMLDIKGTNKDIFVAFKAVGRENDGSVILLWKQLKK